jgi:quercetin dioxygenase-like cupin family protein
MKSTANPWDLPAGCTPYVIPAGHGLATITLGQAIRILAGEEQTNGAFTICSVVGPKAGPVPQHWHEHEHEHDTFFCTRGAVQIWTDEQSRVLYPGGFANVPPGVKHAYALHEHHSEMVGLISPGGFERFFAATGWVYEGSAYPAVDEKPTSPEQFQKAGAEFDVHFVENPVYVNAGAADDDTQLPGRTASYYLRPG